ncbi:MAG TPA: tRNA (adenosine(37)-N6)-threonylcarbamoyltransferase complex dimerization subunit type 1 TsaB [Candidatus Brachybacterium merdigallinarum]|nr:tRNA (adenosine(37)-N6)-threonylcarbamoyltransferase complex dimerization subunit type 1 TsaB [Candidatus Brachybacterium merdigallinarum]
MQLGIDTSGAVSVALARAAAADHAEIDVLAAASDTRARHHDEVLLALIDTVLDQAGATRRDLTGIVVGRGPGPFTGLRVGLVTARTIAFGLGIELSGLCSLDALALQALTEAQAPAGTSVGVALDARRREVYHARYRAGEGRTLLREDGPAVAAPAEVSEQLQACDLLVGSGTALYPNLLPATSQASHVDAGYLLRVAALRQAQGEDLRDTEPLYLRDPDAAKPTARKSALGR